MHAILLVAALLFQQPALDDVLKRASDYVTKYEEELGNLIGTEDYVQNVAWLNTDRSINITPGADATSRIGQTGTVARKQQRRTSADFLIIQVGPDWWALRKTNIVDGNRVKEVEPGFETAFDNSPAGNFKRVQVMQDDSTRYNIGDVLRDVNLPTFALKVLRREEIKRFTFEKAGADRIDGVLAWEVRFKELRTPTLVKGGTEDPPKYLFSHGSLWIEPETGRVLRTEFNVTNTYTKPNIKATVNVRYAPGKRANILVPSLMTEHYNNQLSTIDCRADYSNFRPFEVDVKFDIGPVRPRR